MQLGPVLYLFVRGASLKIDNAFVSSYGILWIAIRTASSQFNVRLDASSVLDDIPSRKSTYKPTTAPSSRVNGSDPKAEKCISQS